MDQRIIFIFLDGYGLANSNDSNPFKFAAMPFFNKLLNGPMVIENISSNENVVFKSIDACLGVEGIPQSATGQTALLTGINAAKLLGYHLPAFPNERLIKIIKEQSILKKVVDLKKKATFANSYSGRYFEMVDEGKKEHSVTTHCVFAAHLPFRNLDDLVHGNAVHWDITRENLNKQLGEKIPRITPYEAGTHLAYLAPHYDIVLYESFLSDLIGHKRNMAKACEVLELTDEFIRGVAENIIDNVTVIISSDHGNIENISISSHTYNTVPLIAIGKMACQFENVTSILEIEEKIINILNLSSVGVTR